MVIAAKAFGLCVAGRFVIRTWNIVRKTYEEQRKGNPGKTKSELAYLTISALGVKVYGEAPAGATPALADNVFAKEAKKFVSECAPSAFGGVIKEWFGA